MGVYEDTVGLFDEFAYGLDFGTYRCALACVPRNMSQLPKVPEYSGVCQGGVPSLFSRDEDGHEYVADQVALRDDQSNDPDGVCASVKTKLDDVIKLHGHEYTPHYIGVQIIRRLLEISTPLLLQEFFPAEIPSLVVGVPVTFGAAHRKEIQKIVREALGGKPVRLVPEPILAALANNMFHKRMFQKSSAENILCFDMGAGTFDTVLLRPNPQPTQKEPYPYIAECPLGTDLAGDRMDQHMAQLLMDKIEADPGQLDLTILRNKKHQDRIKLDSVTARQVKERLSGAEETDVQINGIKCGAGMLHVTRAEYEDRIRQDVEKNVSVAAEVVRKSGHWEDRNLSILLVGGSSYIPLIRQELKRAFPWLKESRIQQRLPEKAVAMGAAIYAARPKTVLPKVSFGYAVDTYCADIGANRLQVRIPSNAKLPASSKCSYFTRFDNQNNVTFPLYEVDHGDTDQLLERAEGRQMEDQNGQKEFCVVHEFGCEVPANTRVDMTVTLDTNGTLTVEVDDLGVSGKKTVVPVTLSNIQHLEEEM